MRTLRRIWHWFLGLFRGGESLCDTCKYDYGSVCTRPERPNARVCPDYKPKG